MVATQPFENHGMIHPARAPVRPRVISPETQDAVPLDDVLAEFQGKPTGAIEIIGGCGAGKTTALAHAAATVGADERFVFLDGAALWEVTSARPGAVVVFTSPHPLNLPGAASYRLAAWGDDELLEYLLAVHPGRCRSVMVRLMAAPPPLGTAPPLQFVATAPSSKCRPKRSCLPGDATHAKKRGR